MSRDGRRLQWSLWVWRDLYNWARAHGSLAGRSPAMAVGISDHVWTVSEYVSYPVHVDDLTRENWAEERRDVRTSALDRLKPRKPVPRT